MKNIILLATTWPYATGIIAIIWLSSAVLLQIDQTLSLNFVLAVNTVVTLVIATVGFRR